MTQSAPHVQEVLDALRSAHGHDASAYDRRFLATAVAQRVEARRASHDAALTEGQYARALAEDPAEAAVLLHALRVTFSEFFRDPLAFALLEHRILPALAQSRAGGELRVWSAGCALGQEAWSLAILLDELRARTERAPSYRIFATDVSDAALHMAREGAYDAVALRNARLGHVNAYFTAHGDTFVVAPRLRPHVTFAAYDMLDPHSGAPPESLYGDFDLILCCNLLFYFEAAARQRILGKLCSALAPGGYLVTGDVERDVVAEHEALRAVDVTSTVFRKRGPA